MMSKNYAVQVDGLGKSYLIGHNTEARSNTFREALARAVGGVAKSASRMARGKQIIAGDEIEEFWALDDVSFNVERGEAVGIVGRNGAGKSTLLKVLARITEPTRGRAIIRGRISSLLEVGTGFHPELTGRENIYLNGSILGMTRREIQSKFDQIVDFSGVEKFIDTPVKRYSSGMAVRLAFSVAAHLEPEILIIDEVLAVGDVEFQNKCLGKMQDVASEGRTVLFVSHNMSAVSSLCQKGILLERGRVKHIGDVDDVLQQYASSSGESLSTKLISDNGHFHDGHLSLDVGEQVKFRLSFDAVRDLRAAIEIKISDLYGAVVAVGEVGVSKLQDRVELKKGQNEIEVTFDGEFFLRGRYFASMFITIPFVEGLGHSESPISFSVDSPIVGAEKRIDQSTSWGSINLPVSVHLGSGGR